MSFLKDNPEEWQSSGMLPSLRSSDAAKLLHDMPLAEAFKAFVIHDAEVIQLSKPLSGNNRVQFMLAEGQLPGPMVDFRWPLDATPDSIAYLFVSTAVSFWEQRDPDPSSAILAISAVLAERIGALRGLLVNGELVACGTFEKTGVEGPIGRLQWSRSGSSIDVQRGDLCDGQGVQAVPKYTGIVLRSSVPDRPVQPAEVSKGKTGTEPNISTRRLISRKDRQGCFEWLCTLMQSSPDQRTRSKGQLLKEAQERWPGLSKHAFEELRRKAIEKTGALAWEYAGAPRKVRER